MKKVLKSLFFLSLTIFSASVFAQSDSFLYNGKTIEIDDRLSDHYGKEYVGNLKNNDPNTLLYFNYLIQNAYKIENIGEKISHAENFNLVKSPKSKAATFNPNNPSSFNFLSYGGVIKQEQQVYKIGNGSEALIIMSKANFFKAFNAYKTDLQK